MDEILGCFFIVVLVGGAIVVAGIFFVFLLVQYWYVFLLLVLLFLVILLMAVYPKKVRAAADALKNLFEMAFVSIAMNFTNSTVQDNQPVSILETNEDKIRKGTMLEKWDTDNINTELVKLKQTGNPIKYYVDSVVERFINGQDAKTVKSRTEWLRAILEQLNLVGQLEDTKQDLELKGKQFLKKDFTLNTEIKELKNKDELLDLEREDAILAKKISIAEKEKKLREIENPPEPKTEPSEKEKIKAQIHDLQDDMDRLEGRKKREMDAAFDEDHREKTENKYNHQIEEIKNKIDELKRKLKNL